MSSQPDSSPAAPSAAGSHELVRSLAEELYRTDLAVSSPDLPVNMGRSTPDAPRGFATEVVVWDSLAQAALRHLESRGLLPDAPRPG